MMITHYSRLNMRGDVAQIERVPFERTGSVNPESRETALELINRWNMLVAKESVQDGNSTSKVFYFLDEGPAALAAGKGEK